MSNSRDRCIKCGRAAPNASCATRDDNGPDTADEQLQAAAARVDAMGMVPEYAEENP